VLLPSGEPTYINLSAWHRQGKTEGASFNFYSGNADIHDKDAVAAARAARKPEPGGAT